MSDLRELYQEVIIDHSKRPRNFHVMPDAKQISVGHNPLCGDKMTVFLKVDDGRITDVSFDGTGCAISMASASLMTESLKGKSVAEAVQLFGMFHELVTSEPGQIKIAEALGKLAAFAGVCEFPIRVKCASLAWHTLRAALEGKQETTTE